MNVHFDANDMYIDSHDMGEVSLVRLKFLIYSYSPPWAVTLLTATIANTGKKNFPLIRRETLTWPSLSANV